MTKNNTAGTAKANEHTYPAMGFDYCPEKG
jgi:hypothetical protein